ncbi:MAG: c-type cytochrome [Myxococcota bacterium]
MSLIRTVGIAGGIAVLGLGLACGEPDKPKSPYPGVQKAAEPEPEAPAATETVAQAEEPTGDPVARGQELYQTYCASCHGMTGAGDGPASAGLNPTPARHNDGTYMNALSDDHLRKVISEGGAAVGKSPLMAGWGGTLDDGQITDVIAFVRSLADPPYPGS